MRAADLCYFLDMDPDPTFLNGFTLFHFSVSKFGDGYFKTLISIGEKSPTFVQNNFTP